MSHAAIVNPLANLGPPMFPMSANQQSSNPHQSPPEYSMPPQLTSAPQMPMLKPAPNLKTAISKTGAVPGITSARDVKLNSDGKPIKKGELDPSTMVHVPGGIPLLLAFWLLNIYLGLIVSCHQEEKRAQSHVAYLHLVYAIDLRLRRGDRPMFVRVYLFRC